MNNEEDQPSPPRDETLYDSGSSLGYDQGVDFQFWNATQPTQSIPQLRTQRQQQLRAQHQHIPGMDVTGSINIIKPQRLQATRVVQNTSMGSAVMGIAICFVIARILGLLRGSLFTYVFGATIVFDAYNQAFLVPDLIYTIVAGGALSSAFMPIFSTYMNNDKDKGQAWHLASSALNLTVAIITVLALVVIVFAPQIVPLYNYGVHGYELALIISLTRIMLLQAIIMGSSVILTSVLNSYRNFLLPAIGSVLYNVGIIVGLGVGIIIALVAHQQFKSEAFNTTTIYAATWGVVLGAFFLVAVQIPSLFKVGMHYTFSFAWWHPTILQIVRLMLPRFLNAAMLSLSTAVDRNLIFLLGSTIGPNVLPGLISQYLLAFSLVLMPINIFGNSISTAAFPSLNDNVAMGRFDDVRSTIQNALRSILFLSIPSSVGLMILSLPVVQVLYEHGVFTFDNSQSMVVPLVCFAVGLPGLAAVEILTRSFYALRDSKTPVMVSVWQFILKIALAILLLNPAVWLVQIGFSSIVHTTLSQQQLEGAWGMGALALSTSVAGLLEAMIMLWLLHQRIGQLQLRSLLQFVVRVMLATLAMGVGLFIARWLLDMVLAINETGNQSLHLVEIVIAFSKLLLEIFCGLFIYLRIARLLSIETLGPVRRLLNRFKLSWI